MLYIYGDSFLHRSKASDKILALMFVSGILFFIDNLLLNIAAFLFTLVLYYLTGITLSQFYKTLKPLIWLFVFIFILQYWYQDLDNALLVSIRLLTLLLLAILLTYTTTSSDMIDAIEKGLTPLKLIGVNTFKVSLAISLTLRFIPVLQSVVLEVKEAQQIRGLDKNLVALIVPVIIRSLKMASEIADAIDSRSF